MVSRLTFPAATSYLFISDCALYRRLVLSFQAALCSSHSLVPAFLPPPPPPPPTTTDVMSEEDRETHVQALKVQEVRRIL